MGFTNFPNGVSSLGVPITGADNSPAAVWATHYFVDGTNGSDGNRGLDRNRAFKTIQKAFDTVSDGDYVHVAAGSYTETLTTPTYGGAKNVSVFGQNNTRGDQCTLLNNSNAIVIDFRAPGWRVSGFRIVPGTSAGVELNMDAATPTTGSDWSPYTQIDNCMFFQGTLGMDFVGAPYSCYILNNTFEHITSGINCSSSSVANVNRSIFAGNFFNNNTNHISMGAQGFNNCWITGNAFNDGATIYLSHTAASQGRNIISGNYLGGAYSSPSYAGVASDMWGGNFNTLTGGVTAANPA